MPRAILDRESGGATGALYLMRQDPERVTASCGDRDLDAMTLRV